MCLQGQRSFVACVSSCCFVAVLSRHSPQTSIQVLNMTAALTRSCQSGQSHSVFCGSFELINCFCGANANPVTATVESFHVYSIIISSVRLLPSVLKVFSRLPEPFFQHRLSNIPVLRQTGSEKASLGRLMKKSVGWTAEAAEHHLPPPGRHPAPRQSLPVLSRQRGVCPRAVTVHGSAHSSRNTKWA